MTREATNRLLEMIDEQGLDARTVVLAALKYMSEDEVADMARINEFFVDEDEDETKVAFGSLLVSRWITVRRKDETTPSVEDLLAEQDDED